MPTLGPTAASAADADRAALHTTASGVPNEHVSRLRQWFCSCASTTITPAAERINWYGKQTNCCIGSTERLQRAPARALTLMTMDDDNCSCFFDELGRCNGLSCSHDVSRWIHVPALACCALDGTLRTSTSNRCSLSCSSRCFQRCPASSSSCATASARCDRWWRLHFLHSTGSVDAPRARVARIARVAPHTIHTHTITQSPPRQPSRRRAARLGRSGAAEQRAIGGGE